MKKPLSIALATMIAASTIAVTAGEASAGPKHYKNYNHHHNNGHYNNAAPLAIFGAIAGLAAAAASQPHYYGYSPYQPQPYPYYGYRQPYNYGYGAARSSHVDWCLNRYRTYNPATNTYFRKPGVPAVCYSPFG